MRYFLLLFFLTCVAIVGVAGFRGSHSRRQIIEVFPDMVRQAKLRPQTPNDFFDDQISSRQYVPGTVAQTRAYQVSGEPLKINGHTNAVYPYEDSPVNTGRIAGTTNWVENNPVPVTRQLLDRGQQRYEINCLPCHGPVGDGKGITAKYGMVAMANFHDKRLVEMTDGEIFNTITQGKNLMGAYGPNVEVLDRWAIISYLRVLQRSQLASVEDLPEHLRGSLKK